MRVVVTGASRGLGLELVRQHAGRGDEVLATCRNPAAAGDLRALASLHPGRVRISSLDVADPGSIARAAADASAIQEGVDRVWSNAGVYPGSPGTPVEDGPVGSLRADDGLSILATNAVGAILVAQAFLPLLLRGDRPRLVAVSSGYGSLALNEGTPYWYGASKAALNMLHRSLAADDAARGVVILALSPGWVRTEMGGPGAPTPVERSVRGMIRVADEATPEQNGTFLDWRGRTVPW
jgi:NAD(P)-dependent dehydrogenase (short-subunit alcohol dehydrogenase family)